MSCMCEKSVEFEFGKKVRYMVKTQSLDDRAAVYGKWQSTAEQNGMGGGIEREKKSEEQT